ncbi:MAG: helix-turn-helix domain-containing protein, partial [Stackebrandtia sp.]
MGEQDDGRKLAFGRFVTRARDQWLAAHPGQGVREFADLVGQSTATLYRWINGSWRRDPSREAVDAFCKALHIDPAGPYQLLGWGVDAPVREATPPASDPDIDALARKLR